MSVRKVAAQLAEEGFEPPGGGAWQPSTLHRVLSRVVSS